MKRRFIFDENYNKKHGKKKLSKLLIILAGIIIIVVIIIIIILVIRGKKKPEEPEKPVTKEPIFELKESITLESGSPLPIKEDYFLKLENINLDDISITYPNDFELSYNTDDCTEEDLASTDNIGSLACAKQNLITPATYGILVNLNNEEYVVPLEVKDTNVPILLTKDKEIYYNEEYKPADFASICHDLSGICTIKYLKEEYATYKDPGEYNIELIATDKYGNTTSPMNAKLIIKVPEKELYIINFDSDGGSFVVAQKIEEGNVALEPSVLKDGYNFLGWYLGNNKYDFNTPIKGNITLKAKWQKININPPAGEDNPPIINVTSITLNYSKIYLNVGASLTVRATIRPSNATNRSVYWSSNNNNVASVQNGIITAKKPGTAIITATAGGKSATVTVTVKENAPTCKYGDTNYNKDIILSVNLTQNNCAIKPDSSYNELLSTSDFVKLSKELNNLGYKLVNDNIYKYIRIYNNTGTGLVGIQIVANIQASNGTDTKNISYILKSDGSRVYITNELGL